MYMTEKIAKNNKTQNVKRKKEQPPVDTDEETAADVKQNKTKQKWTFMKCVGKK